MNNSAPDILSLIEAKKEEFTQLPLFEFIRSNEVKPEQKLVWIPAFAPLAMSFGDIWKHIIRKEYSQDPIQKIINKHASEDAHHWQWFPSDVEHWQFNELLNFSNSLRFLWGKNNQKTRLVPLEIAQILAKTEPIIVLIAIEAIEATANVVFRLTGKITQELQKTRQQEYLYFGIKHFDEDDNHTTSSEIEKLIKSTQFTSQQYAEAIAAVEKIFQIFSDCYNEMWDYSQQELELSSVKSNKTSCHIRQIVDQTERLSA